MKHYYHTIQGWFNYQNLFSKIVKDAPQKCEIVEIGAWKGKSTSYMAVEIFNSNKDIKYNVIDTWQGSIEHKKKGSAAYEPYFEKHTSLYPIFEKNLSVMSSKIKMIFIQESSHNAYSYFQDGSLYFVYVDGSHVYTDVKKDLQLWYPKVQKNGYFAGHDYAKNNQIVKAVNEFAKLRHLNINIVDTNSWVIKI